MGEVSEHWPHRELVTRLLKALDTVRWRTIPEMAVRDPRVFTSNIDVHLWHKEENGYVASRLRAGTGEREFLLTPNGVKRISEAVPTKATG